MCFPNFRNLVIDKDNMTSSCAELTVITEDENQMLIDNDIHAINNNQPNSQGATMQNNRR